MIDFDKMLDQIPRDQMDAYIKKEGSALRCQMCKRTGVMDGDFICIGSHVPSLPVPKIYWLHKGCFYSLLKLAVSTWAVMEDGKDNPSFSNLSGLLDQLFPSSSRKKGPPDATPDPAPAA